MYKLHNQKAAALGAKKKIIQTEKRPITLSTRALNFKASPITLTVIRPHSKPLQACKHMQPAPKATRSKKEHQIRIHEWYTAHRTDRFCAMDDTFQKSASQSYNNF